MKRILALDVGDKRIGVAVSDPLGLTAQGVETIETRGAEKDVARALELAARYETERLLLGLPRSMSGEESPQCAKARAFGDRLAARGCEVRYWDERLTTKAATRTLIEGNVSRQKRKQVVDKLAAVCILQSFLDAGGWPAPEKDDDGGRVMDDNNMELDNIVELVDEEGNDVKFEHLMTVEHEGGSYVLLAPVEPTEDLGDDEVLILKIEEDAEGEETYVGVEDEALLEAVFEKYLAIAEEDDGDDADDEDDEDGEDGEDDDKE